MSRRKQTKPHHILSEYFSTVFEAKFHVPKGWNCFSCKMSVHACAFSLLLFVIDLNKNNLIPVVFLVFLAAKCAVGSLFDPISRSNVKLDSSWKCTRNWDNKSERKLQHDDFYAALKNKKIRNKSFFQLMLGKISKMCRFLMWTGQLERLCMQLLDIDAWLPSHWCRNAKL